MKTVIKTSIGVPCLRPYFSAIALGLLALCPRMQAVVPPPGGGYPGANTATGDGALLSLTSGDWNTAIGILSLSANTTGQFNTGVGAVTLYRNTGDQNTANGAGALTNNTTGTLNTATGAFALFSSNTAQHNTANGASALKNTTDGSDNTAIGYSALVSNNLGDHNTAIGSEALAHNNIGFANTAVGVNALFAWTGAGLGGFNTAIGANALANSTIGTGNIALGSGAGSNVTTAGDVICIGAAGNNVGGSCYIGQIFGATSSGGTAVFVNSNGRLGTATSSRRFKDEIKPMDRASEAILALRPVSFRYKKEIDPQGIPQFGLVAEEVDRVNPDLISRDAQEGKPLTVRYDQVNAMLLNEFLKEHRTVQELKSEIAALTATVKEQAAQIQEVSAQLQLNKPMMQTVSNNH